ncbi:MAG: hypothetical protein ACT6TP_14845 [Blastomonas fulva]
MFRFQPSELWVMDIDDVRFWTDQANRIFGNEG